VQTPAEIFKRFMDFQQSASVTASDWESVVAQSNTALQANPNDATTKAQLFVAQGQIAYMRGDFSNALIQFNAASDALPESALPQYGIGKVYLATKQPNEAENAFEKAIKIDKNFALAYKGVGDALTAQGKTKKAQEYYKDAARVGLSGGNGVVANTNPAQNNQNNQSVQTPNTQPATPYEAELNEAKKLTVRKKWQASIDKLTTLSKTYPTADIYIAIGENYMGMRQFLSAQQAFRKATEVNPNSAVGFVKLGSVLAELNEHQAAYEAFEKALILDQQGTTINRSLVRKMADRANEKAKDAKSGNKKFLGIG
jgi:superkiller protein 3